MKRILSIVCILAMVLSLCNVAVFASETETPIIIRTGAEFKTYFSNDADYWGKDFIIEGDETLTDGSTGIVVPAGFYADSFFYGTVKGITGKNNIQITTTPFPSLGGSSKLGYGDILFENIIIKAGTADGKGNITPNSNGNGVGALVGQFAVGTTNKATFKDITNYTSIESSGAQKTVGGIVGRSTKEIHFENCVNYGNISSTADWNSTHSPDVGGIIGVASGYITVTSCYNHGDISSTNSSAAGIIGRRTTNDSSYVDKSANFGNIESNSTQTNRAAAGIAASYTDVKNSFNEGTVISQQYVGGILGFTTANNVVENCFNVGTIESKATETMRPGGIVGAHPSQVVSVSNCYNIGEIIGYSPRQIGFSKDLDKAPVWSNNYYTNSSENDTEVYGIYITKADLAKGLPEGFGVEWEMVDDSLDFYSYPQLVNNTFYPENKEKWVYVAPVTNAEFNNTQSFSTEDVNDEDYNQYGNYSVVLTKVNLTGIEDEEITEFGMYLLDANGNRLATAEGLTGKRIGGVFGILFYGNKFEDGVTYKAQPYIKAGTAEYTGTPVEFQITDAE